MAAINIISKKELSTDLRLDPEFYHPEYVELLNQLTEIKSKTISYYSPTITRGKLPKYFEDGKIGVIKSAKIQDGLIDESNEFTDENFIKSNSDCEVVEGDILINSTGRGTLGRSAYFNKRDLNYIIDGHITKISDLKGISKYYLAIYLLSKYGRVQLDTMARGSSGQIEIYPYDIGTVLIPEINKKTIDEVESICKDLYQQLESTKKYYEEAEQELLARIQWSKLDISHNLGYSITSSIIDSDLRLDPEYYQPKFNRMLNHLKKLGSEKLSNFCTNIKRGVSPSYIEDGDIFIVNSKDLGEDGIIKIYDLEKTNDEFYYNDSNENARLNQYDVLVYATGAYIGRTNCWLETDKALAGLDCMILKPDPDICNPIYLALFLNSPAGRMQADQKASGSAQRHLYPDDLLKYEIFLPKDKNGKIDIFWQNQIANKIKKSYSVKITAKENLRRAIDLVEKEIETQIKN